MSVLAFPRLAYSGESYVKVTPRGPGDFGFASISGIARTEDEAGRACDDIVEGVRRHVDGVGDVEVVHVRNWSSSEDGDSEYRSVGDALYDLAHCNDPDLDFYTPSHDVGSRLSWFDRQGWHTEVGLELERLLERVYEQTRRGSWVQPVEHIMYDNAEGFRRLVELAGLMALASKGGAE